MQAKRDVCQQRAPAETSALRLQQEGTVNLDLGLHKKVQDRRKFLGIVITTKRLGFATQKPVVNLGCARGLLWRFQTFFISCTPAEWANVGKRCWFHFHALKHTAGTIVPVFFSFNARNFLAKKHMLVWKNIEIDILYIHIRIKNKHAFPNAMPTSFLFQ